MSIKVIEKIWPLNLPRDEKYVLIALADHADESGGRVYPSQAHVAWKTGYTSRQVRTILRKLEDRGNSRPEETSTLYTTERGEGRKSTAVRAEKNGSRVEIYNTRPEVVSAKPSEEPSEEALKRNAIPEPASPALSSSFKNLEPKEARIFRPGCDDIDANTPSIRNADVMRQRAEKKKLIAEQAKTRRQGSNE